MKIINNMQVGRKPACDFGIAPGGVTCSEVNKLTPYADNRHESMITARPQENNSLNNCGGGGAKSVTEVVKRVVAGMDEVASISEESASAAEESSSSVEEQTSAIQELTSEAQGLADVAHELMEGLNKFTISEDEHGYDR